MRSVPEMQELRLTPAQVVREVRHLPSAPKVLPRLKRLLQDGNSSMQEIVNLVRLDTAIAARVLQMGNSVYYNKGQHCQTVEEAVNRVGYNLVYGLVAYAVASQVLVRPLNVYQIEADEIWRQSVACALAAERIAWALGDEANIAYTVGLLHRIGMVVINEWATRREPGLHLANDGFPEEFARSEQAALGFTHADVGAELLGSWDFSSVEAGALRWQYAPRSSKLSEHLASLLYVARWIRMVVCEEPGRTDAPDDDVLAYLQLSPEQLAAIVDDVRLQLKAISRLLEAREPESRNFHFSDKAPSE